MEKYIGKLYKRGRGDGKDQVKGDSKPKNII
jgi:hypothetical protein